MTKSLAVNVVDGTCVQLIASLVVKTFGNGWLCNLNDV